MAGVEPKAYEEIARLVGEYRGSRTLIGEPRRFDIAAQLEVLFTTLQVTEKLNKSADKLNRSTDVLLLVTKILVVLAVAQILTSVFF